MEKRKDFSGNNIWRTCLELQRGQVSKVKIDKKMLEKEAGEYMYKNHTKEYQQCTNNNRDSTM